MMLAELGPTVFFDRSAMRGFEGEARSQTTLIMAECSVCHHLTIIPFHFLFTIDQ